MAMHVSLATATGLWLRIGTRTMSCLLSMFLTEGFLLRRMIVPCFLNDQCSYVLEISLCCLMRGDEDEDDTARLSDLIALAEAGL